MNKYTLENLNTVCKEKGLEWLVRSNKFNNLHNKEATKSYFLHLTCGNVYTDPSASVFKAYHSQLSVLIAQALAVIGAN